MTPKEKAEELVGKYRLTDMNPQDFTDFDFNLSVSNAKQCALICVDEFIDALDYNSSPTAEGLTEYYTEVKQEINKL